MGVLTFSLSLRTVSESNARGHWTERARRARDQRAVARMVCSARLRHLKPPLDVRLTRVAPRGLDDDNLRGALKAVRDGVADALGVDDGDARVRWGYSQARGAHGVRVEVTP